MKRLFTICLLFTFFNLSAQQASWDWVKKAGAPGGSSSASVDTDADGNIYYSGGYNNGLVFPGYTLTGSGGFIAKYSSTGQLKWAMESPGGLVRLDADNNIYIAGSYIDSIHVFDSTFYSGIYGNFFIAKLDSSRNFLWAVRSYSSTEGLLYDISCDGENIYLAGSYKNDLTLLDTTLTSNTSNYDMFVMKIDAQGNRKWTSKVGGSPSTFISPYGIKNDKNGNSYISGYFGFGDAHFGNITLTGTTNDYVAKIDSSGNWEWAKNIGFNIGWVMEDLDIDSSGNCYTLGSFGYSHNQITIDNQFTLTANGNFTDLYVVKWDPLGNAVWARSGGTANSFDQAVAIAVSKAGEVFITGISGTGGTFGSQVLTGFGGNDVAAVKYDTNGNVQWALCAGSNDMDEPKDIAVAADGGIYVTGFYMGAATFGSSTITGGGNLGNAFFAKIEDPVITALADVSGNKKAFGIYPNPSAGNKIQLVLSGNFTKGNVSVQSIEGKLILNTVLESNAALDISALEAGTYIVSVNDGNQVYTTKFVRL